MYASPCLFFSHYAMLERGGNNNVINKIQRNKKTSYKTLLYYIVRYYLTHATQKHIIKDKAMKLGILN